MLQHRCWLQLFFRCFSWGLFATRNQGYIKGGGKKREKPAKDWWLNFSTPPPTTQTYLPIFSFCYKTQNKRPKLICLEILGTLICSSSSYCNIFLLSLLLLFFGCWGFGATIPDAWGYNDCILWFSYKLLCFLAKLTQFLDMLQYRSFFAKQDWNCFSGTAIKPTF